MVATMSLDAEQWLAKIEHVVNGLDLKHLHGAKEFSSILAARADDIPRSLNSGLVGSLTEATDTEKTNFFVCVEDSDLPTEEIWRRDHKPFHQFGTQYVLLTRQKIFYRSVAYWWGREGDQSLPAIVMQRFHYEMIGLRLFKLNGEGMLQWLLPHRGWGRRTLQALQRFLEDTAENLDAQQKALVQQQLKVAEALGGDTG